ncbi:hypothetical protein TREES_T100012877 [Tupaia chinensis]|uniref:Uncharacterized protein n=1 Tax=Tupaia chinensis TaxID=246437 RepID=L9L905_TUPCH|nr:hypothetical protein TREES_T100012877 [Tupaia chinensis]
MPQKSGNRDNWTEHAPRTGYQWALWESEGSGVTTGSKSSAEVQGRCCQEFTRQESKIASGFTFSSQHLFQDLRGQATALWHKVTMSVGKQALSRMPLSRLQSSSWINPYQ